MARLNFNSAPSRNAQSDDSWKAGGFVNMYLPGANGPAKVGAIGFRESNLDEKELLDWAKSDEKAFLAWVKENITFDFKVVRQGGGKFAIPKTAQQPSNPAQPPF